MDRGATTGEPLMFIDFNQISRIGKIVALLGFFLPWITVSCSNTEILKATGWQLMIGDPQPAGPLEGMSGQTDIDKDSEPAVIIIVAFAVIALGLAISLLTRAKTAAIAMLATSVLGIGISYYGVSNLSTELRREISEQQQQQGGGASSDNPFFSADQQRELTQAVSSAITVEEKEGYVVTHSGLLLAALFALLTIFRRRQPEAAAPVAPAS